MVKVAIREVELSFIIELYGNCSLVLVTTGRSVAPGHPSTVANTGLAVTHQTCVKCCLDTEPIFSMRGEFIVFNLRRRITSRWRKFFGGCQRCGGGDTTILVSGCLYSEPKVSEHSRESKKLRDCVKCEPMREQVYGDVCPRNSRLKLVLPQGEVKVASRCRSSYLESS